MYEYIKSSIKEKDVHNIDDHFNIATFFMYYTNSREKI